MSHPNYAHMIRHVDPIDALDEYRDYLTESATPQGICKLLSKARPHLHPMLMADAWNLQARIENAVAEAAELIIISGILDKTNV